MLLWMYWVVICLALSWGFMLLISLNWRGIDGVSGMHHYKLQPGDNSNISAHTGI